MVMAVVTSAAPRTDTNEDGADEHEYVRLETRDRVPELLGHSRHQIDPRPVQSAFLGDLGDTRCGVPL
jgi:hypothetical protein